MAAVTLTSLYGAADGADVAVGNDYVTASSFAPAADQPIYIGVQTVLYTGSPTVPTSVIGNGITYTLIDTTLYGPTGLGCRLSVYRGSSASPSSGTVAVKMADTLTKACNIHILQAANADISGSNGSGATLQYKIGSSDGGSPATLQVTLDNPLGDSTNNLVLSFWGTDAGTANSNTPSGTELYDTSALQDDGMESQWGRVLNPSVTAAADFTDLGGFVIEIKSNTVPLANLRPTYTNFPKPKLRVAA